MARRSRSIRDPLAALTVGALLALASACGNGDEAPTERQDDDTGGVVESLTSEVDAQSQAYATRTASGVVRVEIRNRRGDRLFEAAYRAIASSTYRVDYALYPLGAGASAQPTASSIEVSLDRAPTLEDATTGAVVIHSQFENAVLGNYDSWGCDLLPGRYNWIASCGTKGACCDVHDACYRRYGCTAGSWTSAPWSRCQVFCNAPAVACFVGANPGPSQCCFRGNCGQPR